MNTILKLHKDPQMITSLAELILRIVFILIHPKGEVAVTAHFYSLAQWL